MIYLATALYCEAKPFIDAYQLKKDTNSKRFQIFCNDSICLVLTKSGKINAAIAINELFHYYLPTSHDVFLNFGIAGTSDSNLAIGSGGFCTKLTDADMQRDSYTDFIYRHSFSEYQLTTVSKPLSISSVLVDYPWQQSMLYDMEATGIYTAATMYLKQHQIFFYKVVSDHLMQEALAPEAVTTMLQRHVEPLMEYLSYVQTTLHEQTSELFTMEEREWIHELSQKLYLSVTMSFQFLQLLTYDKLNGYSTKERLRSIQESLLLNPCHSKKEGKIYFEQLRNDIL